MVRNSSSVKRQVAFRANSAPISSSTAGRSIEDVEITIARLNRPNTATGRKAVLWSRPRKEYEDHHYNNAVIKDTVCYWSRFPQIDKHYPGTWTAYGEEAMTEVVSRLTKPTASYVARRQANMQRREFVEEFKALNLSKDIGLKGNTDGNSRPNTGTLSVDSRPCTSPSRASWNRDQEISREERCVTSG